MIKNNRSEPCPPSVKVQIYELLRSAGFSMNEAIELANKTSDTYLTSPQQYFTFPGGVTIAITACTARLVYAPRGYETMARTLEKVEVHQNSEIDKRTRQIREQRQRDERRRPW